MHISQAVNTVEQQVVVIPEEEKRAFTRYFIDTMKPTDKVIIFVGKKLTYVISYVILLLYIFLPKLSHCA